MMIHCLLVDDEPIARKGLLEYIQQISYLNLVGECKNAAEAVSMLEKQPVDLIFLDIQMPRLTGIDLVKALPNPPLIVFITAYPQFALEGYNLDVLDYLLKPVPFPRFLKAVEKARQLLTGRTPPTAEAGYFFIKCNGKIEKITTSKVLYIEGMANYVVIHTHDKKYVTYLTIGGMEAQLPDGMFLRIHKSYIVALHAIISIKGDEVFTAQGALPMSKNLRAGVMEQIERKMYHL